MSNYTRKEQDKIRSAYRLLEYEAGRVDWRMRHRLDDALKHERRERSCIHTARALVIDSFLEGFDGFEGDLSDLYGYADGCMVAVLCGARMEPAGMSPETLQAMREAVDVHAASIARRLEAIV